MIVLHFNKLFVIKYFFISVSLSLSALLWGDFAFNDIKDIKRKHLLCCYNIISKKNIYISRGQDYESQLEKSADNVNSNVKSK